MNLEIFTLCEAASTRRGALDIFGAFDVITASQFPLTVSRFFLAARLRFERHEIGRHTSTIRIADEDGGETIDPLDAEFSVSFERGGQFSTAIVVQPLQPPPFERPSLYVLHLEVDETELGFLPFYVVEKPK